MEHVKGYRGLDTDRAREVRQQGHDDAKAFSKIIGINNDYQNNIIGKKDVVDQNGDTHSIKSGKKKWQIFLYARNRFVTDLDWKTMTNNVGNILIQCIDAFPEKMSDYLADKPKYKLELCHPMKKLKEALLDKTTLEQFLKKSFFNNNEVDYLTIFHNNQYHVFHINDVLNVLANNFVVENSKKISKTQYDNQKVLLKYNNKNIGEIEMRNDSDLHYRQIRFNMLKVRAFDLLVSQVKETKPAFKNQVVVYGKAIKKFLSGKTII